MSGEDIVEINLTTNDVSVCYYGDSGMQVSGVIIEMPRTLAEEYATWLGEKEAQRRKSEILGK